MPVADYSAVVCRSERLPRAEVYTWSLRDALPDIPVPLAAKDRDVALKLQHAFAETYDRTGFDYTLPYREDLRPPVDGADRAWLAETLARANLTGER
jgi:hypothetical protein